MEAGSWKKEAGSWKKEAGSRKMEAGEAGRWKPEAPANKEALVNKKATVITVACKEYDEII